MIVLATSSQCCLILDEHENLLNDKQISNERKAKKKSFINALNEF